MIVLLYGKVVCKLHDMSVFPMKPKRPKKEKKEAVKEKKQEPKEVIVPEEPSSPQIEEESKTVKEDAKPKGSYALADMEKATFDAVCEMMCS